MKREILFILMVLFCIQFLHAQSAEPHPPKIDLLFGDSGIIKEHRQRQYKYYAKVLVQPDQTIYGILTGGEFSSFNKRFSNGAIDKSFGKEGFSNSVLMTAVSAAFQDDGKIVLAGYGTNASTFALARFNTDGSLDKSFSNDGLQTTDFNTNFNIGEAVVVQTDGKILVAGTSGDNGDNNNYYWAMARYNTNGTLDSSFSDDGLVTSVFGNRNNYILSISINDKGKIIVAGNGSIGRYNSDGTLDHTFSNDGIQMIDLNGTTSFQSDGKIVVAGNDEKSSNAQLTIARYNSDGSLDTSFANNGKSVFENTNGSAASIAFQNNGKMWIGGISGPDYKHNFLLLRYNTDGTLDSTFSGDGIELTEPAEGENQISYITIANNRLYVQGTGNYDDLDVLERYILDDDTTTPPTIAIASPINNSTFLAPANFNLVAAVKDPNSRIKKVDFYNSGKLLGSVGQFPYGLKWRNVPVGNYTLTAKATDNSGLVTTSAAVHISIVPNKPPIVSITKPIVKQTVAAPGYIHFEADAKDIDGRIARVEFYNGSTLIRTEYYPPYTYVWKDVPQCTYTITAVAVDNWGARTTSAPVTIRVVNPPLTTANKPSADEDFPANDPVTLSIAPNPAKEIVNIYTKGLPQNETIALSVISPSGMMVKTIHLNSSNKTIQVNISALLSGVYTIKLVTGKKIMYKQFVKL